MAKISMYNTPINYWVADSTKKQPSGTYWAMSIIEQRIYCMAAASSSGGNMFYIPIEPNTDYVLKFFNASASNIYCGTYTETSIPSTGSFYCTVSIVKNEKPIADKTYSFTSGPNDHILVYNTTTTKISLTKGTTIPSTYSYKWALFDDNWYNESYQNICRKYNATNKTNEIIYPMYDETHIVTSSGMYGFNNAWYNPNANPKKVWAGIIIGETYTITFQGNVNPTLYGSFNQTTAFASISKTKTYDSATNTTTLTFTNPANKSYRFLLMETSNATARQTAVLKGPIAAGWTFGDFHKAANNTWNT